MRIETYPPRFNLILGETDCGKSHLYKIIYFVLGSETPPDEKQTIPESIGYEEYWLEIKDSKNNTFTLKRHRKKSAKTYCYNCAIDDVTDKTAVDPIPSTKLSTFLLQKFGIPNTIVLRNLETPGSLTFTDVKKLFFVNEDDISAEDKSPILSTQYTDATRGRSVFKCLISNNDYSYLEKEQIAYKQDINADSARNYIKNLISELEQELKSYEKVSQLEIENIDLDELYKTETEIKEKISEFNQSITKLEDDKIHLKNKLMQNKGLVNRFELLKKYYDKDIKRLDFIEEGTTAILSFKEVNCPLCGASSNPDHIVDYEQTAKAIKFERNKIANNIKELEISIKDVKNEIELNEQKLKEIQKTYKQELNYYKHIIEPKALKNKKELTKYIEIKATLKAKEKQEKLLTRYEKDLKRLGNNENETKLPSVSKMKDILWNDKNLVKEIEDEIKQLIIDWNITVSSIKEIEAAEKDELKVEFDFDECDLKINGRLRTTFGQGVRAVFYSAFMVL